MIIKNKRENLVELIKSERLIRRIRVGDEHLDRIDESISILKAGEYGEQSLDYYLSQIPHE